MYVTQGGTPDQIRYLIDLGIIPLLCDLLTQEDSGKLRIAEIVLQSLENILKLGEQNDDCNSYAFKIKECGGLAKIKNLQKHENLIVIQKAVFIMKTFFDQEIGANSIPQVDFVFF